MAATDSSALSKTLQSISAVKISELDKKRASYAEKKRDALASLASAGDNQHERVLNLLKKVKDLDLPDTSLEELENIRRYTEESLFNPCISKQELEGYEEWLVCRLEFQSRRLDYAKLFSEIITDHLRPRNGDDRVVIRQEPSSLEDSFEVLEKDRLQQLRQKFEEVVFTPKLTDEFEIHNYLQRLFEGEAGGKALKDLRATMKNQCTSFMQRDNPFDSDTVKWVLNGLLRNELVKGEKKQLLKTFQADEMVMDEICDVLNMRWADLKDWEWNEDGLGLDVEPRKQLNGKYRVVMDEDVLQAMLVHFIGSNFCIFLKTAMRNNLGPLLTRSATVPETELDRRQFYLGYREDTYGSIQNGVNTEYLNDFFLCQVPNTVEDDIGYDEHDDDLANQGKKSGVKIKQQLLRHIASEVLLRRRLYSDVAVIQSDLQWYATSIPHTTLFACLRFLGMTEDWIDWFQKYLEVPLNMSKAAGVPSEVRKRKRGVPISHAMEKFLGEVILCYLDLAVKKEANMLMYRMHDDMFLCGPSANCAEAWAAVQNFTRIMGLDINEKKTGSVCFKRRDVADAARLPEGDVAIDFLKLTPESGWIIDETRVNAHVRQLRTQLDQCDSILSFILTYNSCIGRFFGYTFGLPANCLGPQHIDSILKTHQRMQKELFGDGGVSGALRQMLNKLAEKCLDESTNFEVVDSFIFMPPQYGGLGVTNPFISLLMTRENLDKNPVRLVENFIRQEMRSYQDSKTKFNELTQQKRKRRRREVFGEDAIADNPEIVDLEEFLSFDDYTRYRELTNKHYMHLYTQLMQQPTPRKIRVTSRMSNEEMNYGGGDQNETRYTIVRYADELVKKFGSKYIVDSSLAPMGVMKAIKDQKVVWQMVL